MTNVIPYILVCIFAFVFPIGLLIYWRVKTGSKFIIFIVGALTFLVFAYGLEQIAHYLCLINENPVSSFIKNNVIAYALYGGFAAGIFEETGRYVAFKFLLKKEKNREASVAYGIGHGGIEVMLILGSTYVVYVLALLGQTFVDEATTSQILASVNQINPSFMFAACLERISAVILHIGLSMFVFYSVRTRGKLGYFFLAIILHAMADIPAVFYQVGVLPLWAVEAYILAMSILILVVGIRLYKVLPTKQA